MYTGTHDNDTTVGWYNSLDEGQRWHLHAYLQSSRAMPHEANMPYDLIDLAMASKSQLAIIPMQDILALDASHRMNIPGTSTGNWHWRFNWQQLQPEQQKAMADIIERTGRCL